MTLDETVDLIYSNVRLSCKLPDTLGTENIERIIINDASKYFFRNYKYANQKTFYYIDCQSFWRNKGTDVKFITLPDEIESVNWVYQVNYRDMYNLGYLLPMSSISMGQTTQPYVASINVGEWAASMAVMQNFQDALATFNKNTVRNAFNPNSKRFEIQTSLEYNLILDVYAHIPDEFLYDDINFINYCTGKAMCAYAMHLSFTDMQLAGNSRINTDRMFDMGTKMYEEAMAKVSGIGASSFIINKTR